MRCLSFGGMLVGLAAAVSTAVLSDPASAQTGTVYYNTATFTAPGPHTLAFTVTGPVGAGGATTLVLDLGPDGNSTAPVAADPLSSPAAVSFALTKSGTAGTVTFTAQDAQQAGGFTASGTIANKDVIATRAGVSLGMYVVTIIHTATIPVATSEEWTVQVSGLTAPIRGIAYLDNAAFDNLTPAGACSTGCADGEVCMVPPGPCPSVCPLGQSCRGPCPFRPCIGPIIIDQWPFFRIPPWPRPGPVCLSCPPDWMQPFDDRRFERIVITFAPTIEQRQALEARQGEQVQFQVTGGELIGEPFETAGGELMQMVQYPRGDPPRVSVTAAGVTTEEYRATPEANGVSPVYRVLTFLFGLLLALVAGAGFMMKSRYDQSRGTTAR